MQETKIPLYLNKDDAPEKLSQVEAFDLHNVRPTGTSGSEDGYLTNIESTELITDPSDLPSGINITLGADGFKNVKKAYAIKYNSTGRHLITEFDYDTLVEETIFTDLDDTGGVQLFNLSPNHEFNDLKLLHDEYLITADGQSGVIYCINIERLKSGGYGSVITQDSFNLLKQQNLKPIIAEYIDDPNKKSNLLKGKLFQFRTQRGYADYIRSAWSTISKRPIPELESTDSVGDDPSKLNAIKLTVDVGDELTTSLRIASRAGLYDWYIIRDVTREYILGLTDTVIDIEEEIYEAYDPVANTYTFLFYNDGQGEPIAVSDTDEAYDNVPQNVGAIEIVNGDILVLGDIEEGYDRPTGVDVDISVVSYNPQINISFEEDPRDFTTTYTQLRLSGTHRRTASIYFGGSPKTGDIIKLNFGDIRAAAITQTFTYTATSDDNNNLDSFINNLYNILPIASSGNFRYKVKTTSGTAGNIGVETGSYQELKSVDLDLNISGDAEGKTLNILKSNSSYQLALAHYDKFGRQFPIVTNDEEYVANMSSYAETEGLVPQIGWTLSGTPPVGAVSYQWLLTENTKYLSNLFVTGLYDEDESKDDFVVLNLASLARYAKDNENGIVAYEYSEGDRVTFIHNFDGSATPEKWFSNPPLDFAVAGFEIKAVTVLDVTTVKYLLKIKKSSLLPLIDLTDKEVLLELYTPKNNNLSLESKVFYEIGEQFDIVDGAYTTTEGSITTGDAYIRPRKYLSNVPESNDVFAFPVEDFNFSDDYDSKFWSAGRGRTYNDEVGKVQRKASFRYSGEYNIGSLINEINRFYAARIYGDQPEETSSIYGAITKMVMRQQYLIVLQETDVAHIPVFSSIIEDQAEQANLAISTKLFNNARYVGNGLGTGLAKKAISVSNNGTVYFIDPNNGYPCRDGFDGVKVINVKMNKFFIDKLKGVDPKTLIGTYDDFNKEWNISFTGLYGEVNVIPFTEENWEYLDDYDLTAEDVTIVEPEHGTVEIDVDGNLLYTPDEGYFGTDTVGIVFVSDSVVINKNACITITAGINTVDDFSFIPLFNQEIETVLESNINFVQGNTIAVPISIVDGEYRILVDDVWGAWTSTAGTINPTEGFQVRRESADDYEELVSTTLTIADKSATFEITTRPEVFDVPNDLRSGVATRDNCPMGQSPVGTVTYTVPAGTYTAADKAAANALADADVLANKQAYANSTGTCAVPPSIGNDYQAITYYKECPEGQTGSARVEFRAANTYFAATKPLANAAAIANIMSVGQANANASGTCTVPSTFTVQLAIYSDYSNASYLTSDVRGASVEFYNNIGGLVTAKLVTTNVTRNSTVYSFAVPFSGTPFSLGYVKLLPRYAATTVATTDTETLYVNGVLQGNYTHAVASGIGSGFGYSINLAPAGSVTLNTSDVVLITHGTPPPETVYYSAPYGASVAKNDCPSGETPVGTVTLLANYGDFTSTVDQITANNLAIAYVEANKQANANLYGTCELPPPVCDLSIAFSSKTDESVLGANDGTITITGSTSYVGGFVLSKDNGTTYPFTGTSPFTFTGLAPATYNIKARNSNGTCTTSISAVTINAGAGVCDLTIAFSSKTNESISGANDGTITITGSTSHVGGFVLSKDNGSTYPFTGTSPYTFTGLAPATYNIKARNSNGSCVTSISPVVINAGASALFLTLENDTTGSACTITGADLGTENYPCEIVAGGSETDVPINYTTSPINITCYLTFSAVATKAFYYAKFYKNGSLLGTRSFDKTAAGGGFTGITYTGVSVAANDDIKIEVTFQPYSELGTYIGGSGSSSSGVACALTMGDTVIFSSSPDGTLDVGDIALQYYDDGGVGYLVPVSEVSPAPNNFISYLIGATRYWASINTTTGEVLTTGICSAPPPECDLELFYVGKTNETDFGANDGTITVSVATSFAGGWELSKDNGATYPISGSGSSPYTFTGLSPASYLIKARNVDDTCVDALASITINEFSPPLVSSSINIETLNTRFIFDSNGKGYAIVAELIDPTSSFYGNHSINASVPIRTLFSPPYNDFETYSESGLEYSFVQTHSVSNEPEEGGVDVNSIAVNSRISVKNIFDSYPLLTNLYYRLTITKAVGSSSFTRHNELYRILPTPILTLLTMTFDPTLIVTVRVEKIGTNNYNVYADYTT